MDNFSFPDKTLDEESGQAVNQEAINEDRFKKFKHLISLCYKEGCEKYKKNEATSKPGSFSHQIYCSQTDQEFCAHFMSKTRYIRAFANFSEINMFDVIKELELPENYENESSFNEHYFKTLEICESLIPKEIEKIKYKFANLISEYATHFTPKLTNSSANCKALFAKTPSNKPYMTLNFLLNKNVEIPIDYIKLGTEKDGTLGQALSFLEKNNIDSKKDFFVDLKNILTGLIDDFSKDYNPKINEIDYRLRQILIKKDDKFVSITPVGSGPICKIISETNNKIRNDEKKYIDIIKKIHQASDMAKIIISKIFFPVGGSTPRNVTKFSEIQYPLFFNTPEKNNFENKDLYRFIKNGFKLSLDSKILNDYMIWLKSADDYIRDTSTINSIKSEMRCQALRKIVRQSFNKVIEISNLYIYENGENLVAEKTNSKINNFIINGEFYNSEFRECLADNIIDIIRKNDIFTYNDAVRCKKTIIEIMREMA